MMMEKIRKENNLSHELLTPMNALLGYVRLAKQEEMPPKVRAYVDNIETSAEHMLVLIDAILGVERPEVERREAKRSGNGSLAEDDDAGKHDQADLEGVKGLLVEDMEVNRHIAVMLLESIGIEAECAENGEEAVWMLDEAQADAFDAVLMDVQMPVMDGYEAARAIRALTDQAKAGIPIIAVTANALEEDVRMAMEAGMDAHVAKPVDLDRLSAVLRNLL